MLAAEAVHVKRPLQADDGAFGRLQEQERHEDRNRNPDRQVKPAWPDGDRFDAHESADDDMTDNCDHQVGWQVVGAVVMYLFTAFLAGIDCLQEGTEEPTFTAMCTIALEAALHSFAQASCGPLRIDCCIAAESLLLHLCLLRPEGRELRCLARGRPAFDLWNERFEPGRGR